MRITALIEQLKAMPQKMEGFNSDGELVVLNTTKLAESLEKSLRNCDVGTAEDQFEMFHRFCDKYENCKECPVWRGGGLISKCYSRWSQMLYEKVETK